MLLPITYSGTGCRAVDIKLFISINGNRIGMNKQKLRVSVCCPRSAVAQLVCLLFFWLTVPISRIVWPWSISMCCVAPATVPQQLFTRRPPLSALRSFVLCGILHGLHCFACCSCLLGSCSSGLICGVLISGGRPCITHLY